MAILQLLQTLLDLSNFTQATLSSIETLANTLVTLSRFVKDAWESVEPDEQDWATPLSSSLASSLLSRFLPIKSPKTASTSSAPFISRQAIAQHILLGYIKPLFVNTPHPSLHPETGRKLSRIRGGDLFSDVWVEGKWKGKNREADQLGAVGCWKVFEFVISLLEVLWPVSKTRANAY